MFGGYFYERHGNLNLTKLNMKANSANHSDSLRGNKNIYIYIERERERERERLFGKNTGELSILLGTIAPKEGMISLKKQTVRGISSQMSLKL
jgi:hypothetical protein